MDPVKEAPVPEQVREKRTCETCVWWHVVVGSEWRGSDCRKRDPIIGVVMLTTERYSEKDREGTWPLTKADDYCGSWNSKQPKFVSEPVAPAPPEKA